jgi:antitoxin component YwqK of YwqJK toxin-antitoxin module
MTLKYYIIPLLILLCSLSVSAQKQNVYYLKDDLTRVNTKDSADYIRVVREPDSGSVFYNVLEYYKNGTHKLIGKSSKIEYDNLQGECLEYYKNGNRKLLATYKDGMIINNAYEYFPNGKLQSIKSYPADIGNTPPGQDDSSNEGIRILACYDSTGKPLVTDGNGY